MKKGTTNLLIAALKFERTVLGQQMQMHQEDVGNYESAALQKSPAFVKVKQLLGPNAKNGAIKFQYTVSVGPSKNIVAVDYGSTEVYFANGDFDQMDKLGQAITSQVGPAIAQVMLNAYRTNAGCKKALQSSCGKPNSQCNIVVKVAI